MRKFIVALFFIQIFFTVHVYSYGVEDVLDSQKRLELEKTFELADMDIDALEIIDKLNRGDFSINDKGFWKKILVNIKEEFLKSFTFITPVFAVIMLAAIVDNLNIGLKNNDAAEFVISGIIVLSLIGVTYEITEYSLQLTDRLILFINSLIPTLLTLLATGGNVSTSGALSPIMLGVSSVISLILKSFVIPLSLIGLAVKVTGDITKKAYLENFGNQVQKILKWALGLVFTVYVGIIGIIGVVAPEIDSITLKTTKYAVGNFIPYVGGMVSDSVELILACSGVVKNSVGIVGLIAILAIVVIPCVKIVVKIICLNVFSLVVSLVAGKGTVNMINYISNSLSFLLGTNIVVSIMYILSIAVIIFVGGA